MPEGRPGDLEELLAADAAHVWHPYATLPPAVPPYLVEAAEGVRLRLADGRELVDGMSSWWAAIHGYRHPVLDAAVKDQLGRMSHVMFGGLTHAPAVELARTLVELAPDGLEHVFLADSGSVSVEVAIKMCLQYQRATGRPQRRRLGTWRGGYHGDTFHPMSICDPEGGMHHLWGDVLPRQVFAPVPPGGFDTPPDPAYEAALVDAVQRHADELAAVIVEPVVQGAGGMRFHHPHYLRVLREVTRAHGVLLIFDEIATGFGRTGTMFAAEHAGVVPDVMCVGKALTGGYLTLAAALCTPRWRRASVRVGCWHTARRSWVIRSPVRSPTRRWGCCGRATGPGRWRGSSAICGPAWSRCAACRAWPMSGSSAASAWCNSTTRSTWRPPPPPRWARGVAAPVPGFDLHDAAVRHRRR